MDKSRIVKSVVKSVVRQQLKEEIAGHKYECPHGVLVNGKRCPICDKKKPPKSPDIEALEMMK